MGELLKRFVLASCNPNEGEGDKSKDNIDNRACERNFNPLERSFSVKAIGNLMGLKTCLLFHSCHTDVTAERQNTQLPFNAIYFPLSECRTKSNGENFDFNAVFTGDEIVS